MTVEDPVWCRVEVFSARAEAYGLTGGPEEYVRSKYVLLWMHGVPRVGEKVGARVALRVLKGATGEPVTAQLGPGLVTAVKWDEKFDERGNGGIVPFVTARMVEVAF